MVLYAKDIVEIDFLTLPPTATVYEASKEMMETKHGFALIGEAKSPEGIVTEWDILAKVIAVDRDPKTVVLREIMSTDLVAVDYDTGLSVVSQLMTQKGVRRLLVKKEATVVGVITARTMLARMNEYVDKVSAQISRLQTPWF